MSNLVPFGQGQVPSYVAQYFAPEESNIAAKLTVPALSFRGKAWRIVLDDQETLVTDKAGDPVASVSVIILDQIKKNSRVFYEGQYVTGENKAPNCSSVDGIKPDASIEKPVAATCAACPNAVKGSKITQQGKATTLCDTVKRVAVIPSSKLDFTALLLRLAPTSNWDKTTENEEWKAWAQYMDYLRAQGVTNTVQVVTKVKFDSRAEYPKLLFKADRWTTQEELAVLSQRWKSDEVKNLLLGSQAELTETDDGEAPPAAAAVAQPAPASAPAATPAPTRTRAARPKPEPAPAPAAAPAAVGEDEGSWGESAPAAAAQQAPAPQPAAAPAAVAAAAAPATANAGLSSLLGSWDD
jgi:hypothetical protein